MGRRVLLALVAASLISGCDPVPPAGPMAADFKPGSCHQVAAQILDVVAISHAVDGGQQSAAAAEGPLTSDQHALAEVADGLADPAVQARVRAVVVGIGFFRFTLDHHTFDGSQNRQLGQVAASVVSACVSARPSAS